ncbi:MAG TPA: hypothetical protein VM687_16810 [Stenotrophomonas sp.]|nr:hypothetical protein [Stenotrophomonas sp.]
MVRFLLAGVAGLACFAASAQANEDWLAGTTWVLCVNGAQSTVERDALVFDANGSGRVIRSQGNLAFRHQRTGNTVALSTATSQHPVQLVASADHTLLQLRGPDGGPVASYTLQGSAAMAQCDAR